MILLDANTWSAVGTCAAAIIALFYTIVTYKLLNRTRESLGLTRDSLNAAQEALKLNKSTLKHTSKIAEYDIYMRIADQLNSEKAFEIIEALNKEILKIDDNRQDMFATNGVLYVQSRTFRRYILYPLEDLAKFCEDGLITIESVDSGFGYIFIAACNNYDVAKYIAEIRAGSEKYYSGIERIYYQLYKMLPETDKAKYKAKLSF